VGEASAPVARLARSVAAWDTPEFSATLKQELEQLGPAALPLQQGVTATSYALDDAISVMVIGARGEPDAIRARVGVFFAGIVAGCSCADDPTPVEAQSEYCELQVDIDRGSAHARFSLL